MQDPTLLSGEALALSVLRKVFNPMELAKAVQTAVQLCTPGGPAVFVAQLGQNLVSRLPGANVINAVTHLNQLPTQIGQGLISRIPGVGVAQSVNGLIQRMGIDHIARSGRKGDRIRVDLEKIQFSDREKMVFAVIGHSRAYSRDNLDRVLNHHGIRFSPQQLERLHSELIRSAEGLQRNGLLRQRELSDGNSIWTLTRKEPISFDIPPPVVLTHLAKEAHVVDQVVRRYGEFNQENLGLWMQVQGLRNEESRAIWRAVFELEKQGILLKNEATGGMCPALSDFPKAEIEVQLADNDKNWLLQSPKAIDQRIGEILKEYGTFNEQTFEAHFLKTQINKANPQDTLKHPNGFAARVQSAKEADLVAYCQNQGYELEPDKKGWYRVAGQGGLFVKDNSFHQFSTGEKGKAIDFVMKQENKTFKEAIEALTGYQPAVQVQSIEKTKPGARFELKENQLITNGVKEDLQPPRRLFAYLNQTRGIEKAQITELLDRKLAGQDGKGNILFFGQDKNGAIRSVDINGTLDQTRFKGIRKGSDQEYGFSLRADNPTVYVVEAPIEALSLRQLHQAKGINANYLSLSGLKEGQLWKFLEENPHVREVVLALNHDPIDDEIEKPLIRKGIERAVEIELEAKEKGYEARSILPPTGNDWNDLVRKIPSKLTAQQGYDRMAAYRKAYQEKLEKNKEVSPDLKAEINKSYNRHLNRLLNLKQPENLVFSSPELRQKKEEFSIAIEIAKEKKLPIPDPLERIEGRFGFLAEAQKIGLKQMDLQFMENVSKLGVVDQKGWRDHCHLNLLKACHKNTNAQGEMPDFGALYLEFEKLNNKGLGKLIKNGYIGTEKIAIPTRWNTNPSKQVYFLTEKGSDLLTSVGIKPTTKGPYTKKASELRHDLLVGQVFRNELQKAFLEGRKIHEIKTDHDLRAESASKVETLHRTIMKKTGFSKEDLIELSRLEKKQKKAPLSEQEQQRYAELRENGKHALTPKNLLKLQDLERLYEIGKLGTDQEQSFTELRKNASLCQAEIGELDTLKKQAMPDLVIVFEEEEIVLNEAGEPITINSLNTQNYEIDSGGSSEAGGGYRRNEILLKLQGIQGDLNWAVPGGINSAQGKKVQAMIKATRSKARVMSI